MKLSFFSALVAASTAAAQAVLHPNTAKTKCLEVRGDVQANGTAVQIFDCNNTPAQVWMLNWNRTSVRLANSTLCLDAGSSPGNNIPMKISQCVDELPSQTWFLTEDMRIALFGQGLCLDLPNGNTTNGNVVQTYRCTDGNTNQIWNL